jgi:hypothetical protein
MTRIFSNGPTGDFVVNPYDRLIEKASQIYLAAPYYTESKQIVRGAAAGKKFQLLVGLNSVTTPRALESVHGINNVSVRYLTHRFHAKIFIFDDAAILGSSNLTDGGLMSNREGVICLDQPEDSDAIEEIRVLFLELWESGNVLTEGVLAKFKLAWAASRRQPTDPDLDIEEAIGRVEPRNIDVGSRTTSRERIFLQDLRRQVYEQYRPAFREVTEVLEQHGFRRTELQDVGKANETNRFLNWVRLTYAVGDEAWQSASIRQEAERRSMIRQLGEQWATTPNSKVPPDYIEWLHSVRRVFGAREAIQSASADNIMDGLLSLHAFAEQQRFIKGGRSAIPAAFWTANKDAQHVKESLANLIHGPGDFIQRLHDILYDTQLKLAYFGYFCALELYGTLKPEECPPINGRMAKALRYLGYEVRGA